MEYYEASRLMESARSPERGKPLRNNTRLYHRGEDYAVELHATDVVTIHSNGTWTLNHGGWETVTTADRIRDYSPATYRTWWGEDGSWMVRLHARPSDPEPDRPDRTIPRPFRVADPGPAPEKAAEGCWAGHRHAKTTFERHLRDCSRYSGHRLTTNSRIDYDALFTGYKGRPRSTRSRDLVYSLERIFRAIEGTSLGSIFAWDCETVVTDYVDTSNTYWHRQDGKINPTQCAHCAAFASEHSRWHAQMHGASWGRGSNQGYAQMCEWLEEFGSFEAWQDAYITEYRLVREARKRWREWDERNKAAWWRPITIDANGVLTKKCSDALRREKIASEKADRAYKREERRRQREHEARLREQRQLERFKARVRKRRPQPVQEIAREAVVALSNLNTRLTPNDSLENTDAR